MATLSRHHFNYAVLDETAHRPWPMPDSAWVMTQTWHDLLFAHWPIDPAVLRPKVPSVFPLDLFDGRAWLGIVPFFMTNVAPRFLPALPGVSAFPELNVRTYVRLGDKAGVFFFSLDAGSALAVGAARGALNLPYFTASMHVDADGESVTYSSRREPSSGPSANFSATYRPTGPARPPEVGSLEYFLTERYCLYALDRRSRPYRLDIHHPPWPLHPATADITINTMADPAGVPLPPAAPLLHFARRQDMVAWPPQFM